MNKFARSCVSNVTAEGFNFVVRYNAVYNTAGDGYCSEVVKAVAVTEIGMYVSTNDEEYSDGDFYVLYDEATWDNDTDGLIYTDSEFLYNTQCAVYTALTKMGVEDNAAREVASTVQYSEQGMQDYGRVSFDAYKLADTLRSVCDSVEA
jgi:hypothetical protein